MSDDASEAQLSAEVDARATEIAGLISRNGSKAEMLAAALANPPLQSKNPETKDRNFETVCSVFTAIPDGEIPAIVEGLDLETADVLMKYVFRAMGANPPVQPASMLKWHSAVVAKAGLGSIVRAMADRKTV